MENEDTYWRSSSFNLVVFLYTKGAKIAGISPTSDSGRQEFVLMKTDRLMELIKKYKWSSRDDPDLLVPVGLYEQSRRELLDRLKQY
jgi:hypothetical protein